MLLVSWYVYCISYTNYLYKDLSLTWGCLHIMYECNSSSHSLMATGIAKPAVLLSLRSYKKEKIFLLRKLFQAEMELQVIAKKWKEGRKCSSSWKNTKSALKTKMNSWHNTSESTWEMSDLVATREKHLVFDRCFSMFHTPH